MRAHHREFLEFFFGEMFPEPHSTKQVEDAVAYGLDGSVEALLMEDTDPVCATKEEAEALCRRVRCPVLVVQGDRDNCQPAERGRLVAELTGGERVQLAGAGPHPDGPRPGGRQPADPRVRRPLRPARRARRTWARAGARPRRALLVSSPIGLGHAWRDVAIARELRRRVPGLEVHWLAQAPVTTLLEACGETVHPASAALAPEAAGVDAEAGEHELHAFQMLRRLDEIFCANFMVFHDLVRGGAVRPLDRRRGLGGRLLPAREPGAQDRAVRLADRLRGRAADARRRRARGVPRRRHQRPDGRARRPPPAAARPLDLHRRPRRHRARAARARPPGDPRRGPRSASGSPATSPASTPPRSPTATRCAPSSATSPASRSASSRPAAPAPASTSCNAPPRRSPRRSGASPSCA